MGLLVLNLWQRRRPAAELAGGSPNPVPIPPPASAPPVVGSTPAAAAPEPVTVMSRPPVAEPPAPPELPEELEFEEPSLVNLLVDPVTGLESHFAWDRELRNENARLRRYGRPYTIVVAELDGLDRLADRVGAEAAGRIVPAIGQVLRRQAREPDHVARTGPARFGVLLVETDEVRAINYVERVRAACDVWLQAGAVALQLSFGWASPGPDADTDAALLLAQERLQSELAVARRRAMAS
jgi:diguanylate cyclase (GGDEF)-like protein